MEGIEYFAVEMKSKHGKVESISHAEPVRPGGPWGRRTGRVDKEKTMGGEKVIIIIS